MAKSRHHRPERPGAAVEASGQIKVAILGGGIASIVAAFRLSDKAHRDRYKIMVYQRGWRLGGKCASGRNPEHYSRIEEHGLHVWFGFYDYAFQVMRDCYEELDRPSTSPLATLEKAFIPHSEVVLCGNDGGRRQLWEFYPSLNSLKPGDPADLPGLLQMVETGLGWLVDWWRQLPSTTNTGIIDRVRQLLLALPASAAAAIEAGLAALGLDPWDSNLGGLLVLASNWAAQRSADPLAMLANIENELIGPIEIFERALRELVEACPEDDELRLFFVAFNTSVSILRGILADDLINQGFDRINNVELSTWLRVNGADALSLNGFLVTALYDMAFAYLDGDIKQPNLSAGTTISAFLKLVFGYKGAFLYKMAAGMGDTVFGPFYEVLKRRGVEFKFFHCVSNLGLSAQRDAVETIEIVRQVELRGGAQEYSPLFDVKGLPCWPSHPLWDQLENGAQLEKNKVNFEWDYDPLGRNSIVRLQRGTDFDHIVLGISVAALPGICGELVAKNRDFAAMLDHAATTMTQAFQVWANKPLKRGLGYAGSDGTTLTGYVEPLDTYSDMSHLVEREGWPSSVSVKSIGYFCGVLDDRPGDTQQRTLDRVRCSAIAYLNQDITSLWLDATSPGGGSGFDWNLLVDPAGREGENCFRSQYWISNYQKSERYVQTPAGNVAFRLKADQSGFKNLKLAGDWVRTGLDSGCVESAVMAGVQAANALISGQPTDLSDYYCWLKPSKPQRLEATGAPNYVEYAGLSTVPPPYLCADTVLYGFFARADRASLKVLCDKVFSIPTGGAIQCDPIFGSVMITIGRTGRLVPLATPYSRKGYSIERQASLWVPVILSRRRGTGIEPLGHAWFQPYIFVDNPISLIGGREIFGYNKTWGWPTLPSGDVISFTLDVFGSNFNSDELVGKRRLLELKPTMPGTPASRAFVAEDPSRLLSETVAQIIAPMVASPELENLVREFIGIKMKQVFLKESRSIDDGTKASSLQVTQSTASVTNCKFVQVLSGEWDLIVRPLDSHPLAADLGLLNQTIVSGFVSELDFELGSGEVLWDGANR
jgi:uncharacterized protein with NAD-binding domain and iron-sulfur cluster